MNNKDYIAELAQQTGYSQDDTQKMVRKVIDAMIAEFEEGEMVSIPNFGTFEVKKRLGARLSSCCCRQGEAKEWRRSL